MAQRTLDAAFWDDEKIATLSFPERLLFACMFTDVSLSDDWGYLPAAPRTLKKHAFGYDDNVSTDDVRQWRDNIVAKMASNVVLYEVDGQEYIYLAQFPKWQKLRHHRQSNIPRQTDPRAKVLNSDAQTGRISENFRNAPQDCGNSAEDCGNSAPNSRMGRVESDSVESDRVELGGVGDGNTAALFGLVEKAGIMVNPLMAEQYEDILRDAGGDIKLIEAAFQEAVKQGSRPMPAWLAKVVDRCKREGCMPGEWPQAPARASPPAKQADNSDRIAVGPGNRWG
jgi:hypothetical protein